MRGKSWDSLQEVDYAPVFGYDKHLYWDRGGIGDIDVYAIDEDTWGGIYEANFGGEPNDVVGLAIGPLNWTEISVKVSDLDHDTLTVTLKDARNDEIIAIKKALDQDTVKFAWKGRKQFQTYKYYIEITDGKETCKTTECSFTTEPSGKNEKKED